MDRRWISGGLAALLVAVCSSAEARPPYNNHVPNGGEFECEACHTEAPWLNSFGWDVGFTMPLGNIDWSQLWYLDSDADGQTNGFELGDPCGEWVRNGEDPAREENLSDPSDPLSVVPDEIVPPECPDPGDDDDSAADDDDDDSTEPEPEPEPCGYSLAGAGSATPAALGLLLFAAALRRRRC